MTRGSNERPTRRLLSSKFGDEYVVELRAQIILIRPKGARRGGKAEVAVTPGAVYVRAIEAAITAAKKEKKKLRRGARR